MLKSIYAVCKECGVTPFTIFENVVPADKNIIGEITNLLNTVFSGDVPILINAADAGWITRRRLIWTDPLFSPELGQFVDISLAQENGYVNLVIPRTRRILPALGGIFWSEFKPIFLASGATAEHPEGRFPVLTNRLHPGQRPHGEQSVSAKAKMRNAEAEGVLPFYWFEDGPLLLREASRGTWEWRFPNVDEVEDLMGSPLRSPPRKNPQVLLFL